MYTKASTKLTVLAFEKVMWEKVKSSALPPRWMGMWCYFEIAKKLAQGYSRHVRVIGIAIRKGFEVLA